MADRIIRVFPRRTKWTPDDSYAFVGDPPMFRPVADAVMVSCTFTWDRIEAGRLADAWRQHYPATILGGPAFADEPFSYDQDRPFVPGQFIRTGVTFTTRGCNKACPWCLVPEREGRLREIEDFAEGPVIQDNNFLQASTSHRARVYQMLNRQGVACYSGGLDASLVTDAIAEELRGVNVREVFLAADTEGSEKPLRNAINRLRFLRTPLEDEKGEPARAIRCYMLLAYGGETIRQAEARLERVWELGAVPFAQLFQPPDQWIEYDADWRALRRKWQRPAAMFGAHRQQQSVMMQEGSR